MLSIKVLLGKLLDSFSKIGIKKSATGSTISVSTSTYTNITSLTLEPGTWAVFGMARFPSNATGRRMVAIGPNNAASNTVYQMVNATNGGITALEACWTWTLTTTTTEYLVAWQNSGGALNVTGYLAAVRIK